MKQKREALDTFYLQELIKSRNCEQALAVALGVTQRRFSILLEGKAEFSISEMILCAAVLGLDECEFSRCFFTAISSENLN